MVLREFCMPDHVQAGSSDFLNGVFGLLPDNLKVTTRLEKNDRLQLLAKLIASHIIPHETTTYHFSTPLYKLNKGDTTCKLMSFRGAAWQFFVAFEGCQKSCFQAFMLKTELTVCSLIFTFAQFPTGTTVFKSGGATARSKQALEVQCSWRSVAWDVT